MKQLRIYPSYVSKAGASGGGNNFMSGLAEALKARGSLATSADEADAILINLSPSFIVFQLMLEAVRAKIRRGSTIICRLAGPIELARNHASQAAWDRVFFKFAELFGDGIVYQSQWSRTANRTAGAPLTLPDKIIVNVPRQEFFDPSLRRPRRRHDGKIRLLSASWSDNPEKGGDTLEYLDRNLDFERYDFRFVGRIKNQFSHISVLPPVTAEGLSELLQESDIFIFPSKVEACSNMLLEAVYSGIPVVAANRTSNPEILPPDCGCLYDRNEDIPALLEQIAAAPEACNWQTPLPTFADIAGEYEQFIAAARPGRSFSSGQRWRRSAQMEYCLYRNFGVSAVLKFRIKTWCGR